MNESPHIQASAASPTVSKLLDPARRTTYIAWGSIFCVVCVIAGLLYWNHQRKYVFSEHAEVSAPLIELAPMVGGELKRVSVRQGESVSAFQTVARVGDEIISTHVPGIVTNVQRDIGAVYQPGQAVVTMIDPQELHIVAHIEEDKGINEIQEGQNVIFTVDAFGSEQFEGTVESLARTKKAGDVVFSISDKREMQEFDVRIQYDRTRYPQFQNGMSARVWIVK